MTVDQDIAEEFALLGVAVEVEAARDDEDDGAVLVWDCNWPALTAFLALATQWRKVSLGMSGVLITLGLDYQAADVVLRRQGASDAVFADLQVMEAEALDIIAEAESASA